MCEDIISVFIEMYTDTLNPAALEESLVLSSILSTYWVNVMIDRIEDNNKRTRTFSLITTTTTTSDGYSGLEYK